MKNARAEDTDQFDELVSFISTFVRAEQRYGGYSFETELFLSRAIKKLGLNSEILATPNSIEIALWKGDTSKQTIRLAVTKDSSYDLNKIDQIHKIVEKVVNSEISIEQGLELINKTNNSLPIYSTSLNALAFVLCGLSFAVIIGASWLDFLFAGLLSLITFEVIILSSHSAKINTLKEFISGALAIILATIITLIVPGLNPLAITVCAVVWFIPGFGLTTAPREIIYGNTLSGLIYLTNAVMVGLKLLIGALMGIAFIEILLPKTIQDLFPPVDPIWAWGFAPLLGVGLAILFKVSPKKLVLVFIGGFLVWTGVQLGNIFGSWEGTFLGAIILAIFANFSTTKLRITSTTVTLPVVMLLVPGYAFLSALYILHVQGLSEGFSAVIQVIITIVVIIAGIFVGDTIVSADFSKLKNKVPSKFKLFKHKSSEK